MDNRNFSNFIEQVRTRSNIIDISSKYFAVEKRGKNHWACCPFHHESVPSFTLDEYRNTFHCFGCDASGDVFKLVMEMESCSFMDSVKILAEKAGLQMPEFKPSGANTQDKERKERLYTLMRDAGYHYHNNLIGEKGVVAREYLAKRGLSATTVRSFAIGISLGDSDLVNHLSGLGYTKDEMLASGVCEEKNARVYDALFGRIIIPILNNMSKVIAFGGRYIGDTDFAKYKNTKETIIFEKRKELFGVHTLKKIKQKQKLNSIIVVEGYMDVISLYQAGFTNACASMGTALTEEQCRTLKYFCDNIILCYDGDNAGQKATYRGIDILKQAKLNAKIAVLSDKLDPDDYIKQFGAEQFSKLLGNAISPVLYKIQSLSASHDLNEPDERAKFALSALEVIKELDSNVEQEIYLPFVAKYSKVDIDVLRSQLKDGNSLKTVNFNRNNTSNNKYLMAARYVIYCLYNGEKFVKDDDLHVEYFDDIEYKNTIDYYKALRSMQMPFNIDTLIESGLSENEINAIKASIEPVKLLNNAHYYQECIAVLKSISMPKQIDTLIEEFKRTQNVEILKLVDKLRKENK